MAKPSASVFVAVAEPTAFIRVVGRATFTTSVPFKTLIYELKQRQFNRFVLELSECLTMDSTFLGVLAGFALKLAENGAQKPSAHLQLFNSNQRVTELLENLGVLHLFELRQCAWPDATPTEQSQLQQNPLSPEEIARTCLDAHQALMTANPANIPKFKDVTQFLADDLKKLAPPPNPPPTDPSN